MSMLDAVRQAKRDLVVADRTLYNVYCATIANKYYDRDPLHPPDLRILQDDNVEFQMAQQEFLKLEQIYLHTRKKAIEHFMTQPDIVMEAITRLLDRYEVG